MKNKLKDTKINLKIVIAGLWIAIMFLYIYNDIFHLFKPDAIQNMMDGQMGPFAVTQMGLFTATVLMVIPSLMVIVALVCPAKMNRIANIIFGSLYTIVNIANLPGEWVFYIFSGVIQIFITLTIVWISIKWPKQVLENN